jgi:prepilin-type N-terminal cleavage/methylation domain-containing protein/prepilin-type processing-associated H-X9-DG protein
MGTDRRRGFTLIELLVVVAIIALLIAILLPSLGRAKMQGVRTKCVSVLRQWGVVINTYAQENDGVFVIKLNGQGWNSTGNNTVQGSYATQWAARMNTKLRVCPGGTAEQVANNTTMYNMIRYNPTTRGVNWNTPGAGGSSNGYKLTQFKTPAERAVMLDVAPLGVNPWISSLNDTQAKDPALPDALKERHGGTGGVLFLDAHAEIKKYQEYVDNIPSITPVPAAEMAKPWTLIDF